MKIFDKIVISTVEPAGTNVLWYNPLVQDLFYFGDGWVSVHNDFVGDLENISKYTLNSIYSLQKQLKDIENKHTGDIVSINDKLYIIENNLNRKQDKLDDNLITTDKTVVGGINEVNSKINKVLNTFNTKINALTNTINNLLTVDNLGFVYNPEHKSHAFGFDNSTDIFKYTSVFGIGNTSSNTAQTVLGKYAKNYTDSIFTVGIGNNASQRYNAFTVCNGVYVFGDNTGKEVTIKLQDLENLSDLDRYINDRIPDIPEIPEIPEIPDYTEEFANIEDALSKKVDVDTLETLEDKIFATDGNLTHTFINTMMAQIGADSMNYELTDTSLKPDGTLINCAFSSDGSTFYIDKVTTNLYGLSVDGEGLVHYIYYWKDEDNGNKPQMVWVINNGIEQDLLENTTYYICIKCNRYSNEAQWICSTDLYTVEMPDDSLHYYFNWGILLYVNGKHTLVETRGCSYMYGDNIVTGKIKSLGSTSWFDLTNGEFVLGSSADNPALSFRQGTLSIAGYDGQFEQFQNALNDFNTTYQTLLENMQGELESMSESYASLQSTIDDLKKQNDGEICNYFYNGTPSKNTYPVYGSEEDAWLKEGLEYTEEEKENIYKMHSADTYTDILESSATYGYSYKWIKNQNKEWEWIRITDSATLAALQKLSESISVLKDGKSTTFYDVKPSNYKRGDLWIITENHHPNKECKVGEIWNAVNDYNGIYSDSDWENSITYTTKEVVEGLLDDLKTNIEVDYKKAIEELKNRINVLVGLNSDGLITKNELNTLRTEIKKITSEYLDTEYEYKKYFNANDTQWKNTQYYLEYNDYIKCLETLTKESSWAENITSIQLSNASGSVYNLIEHSNNYYTSYVDIRKAILDKAEEYLESFVLGEAMKYFGDITIGGTNLYYNSETLYGDGLDTPKLGRFWAWAPATNTICTCNNAPSNDAEDPFDSPHGSAKVTTIGGNYKWKAILSLLHYDDLDKNSKYTVSCDIQNTGLVSLGVNVKLKSSKEDSDNFNTKNEVLIGPKETKHVVITGYPYQNNNYLLLFVGVFYSDYYTSNTSFKIKNIKVEKGSIPTEWSPSPLDYDSSIRSLYYLKQAFEGTTDITGGAVFCNLIHLRDANGDVSGGINGIEDTLQSEGVTLWSGGDYKDASAWATAHNRQTLNYLTNTLPIIITKTGKGSKLGPLEIEDLSTACIYNTDRTSRILLSTNYGPDSNIAILTQVKEGGVWVTKTALTDGSILNTFKLVSLNQSPVKPNDLKSAILAVPVNTTLGSTHSWKLNCNEGHTLNLQLSGMKEGGFSLVYGALRLKYRIKVFVNGSSESQYNSGILSLTKETREKNDSQIFSVPLKGLPQFLKTVNNLGNISSCKIQIEFVSVGLRLAGIWYDYDFNDDPLRNFKVKWYFNNNISFVTESTDTKGVHLGKDGIKVVIDSEKIFAVRNKDSYIDVNIQGLPNSSSVASTGLLYQDGNYLKIKS